MSRISIKIDVDFTEGELKDFTGNLWTKSEKVILNILRRHDAGQGVTKQQISRGSAWKIRDAKTREEILKQLIEEGIIEIISGERAPRYRINRKE